MSRVTGDKARANRQKKRKRVMRQEMRKQKAVYLDEQVAAKAVEPESGSE